MNKTKSVKKPRVKRRKLPTIKNLQKKAFNLCKIIVFKRDGFGCQVKKHFPQINVAHTPIDQVDHCFSRANKNLFLDVSNLTVICSGCNMSKGFDTKAIDVAVHDIVRKREGNAIYERMKEIAMSRSANVNWGKRWWIEQQIAILEGMLTETMST